MFTHPGSGSYGSPPPTNAIPMPSSSSYGSGGGGGEGIGGLLGGAASLYGAIKGGQIADENLELQQDVFAYNKDLQQTIFDREDNAVQRRMADMRAGGINPLLAAGSAARAGEAIKVTAPQRSFAGAQMAQTLGRQAVDISRTNAEVALIRAQARKTSVEADMAAQRYGYQGQQIEAALDGVYLANDHARRTLDTRVRQAHTLTATQENALAGLRIDREWQREFAQWLRSSGNKTGALSPGQLNFMALAIRRDLDQLNVKHYQTQMIIKVLGRWGVLGLGSVDLRQMLGLPDTEWRNLMGKLKNSSEPWLPRPDYGRRAQERLQEFGQGFRDMFTPGSDGEWSERDFNRLERNSR